MGGEPEFEDEAAFEPESSGDALGEVAEPLAEESEAAVVEATASTDVVRLYLNDIGTRPLLTPDEEARLSRLARQGDFEARQKMIEHNLRLVVNVAKHYLNRGIPLLDLIAEGNLGLIHALGKFDPDRGFRFSTYATWWIRQSVERAIMNQSRTIRLPVYVVKEINLVMRACRHLEAAKGGESSVDEVAALIDRPTDEVRRFLRLNEHIVSLDAPLDIDPDFTIGDALADERSADPVAVLETGEISALVSRWLAELDARQREVVERRYGLGGADVATLEEIAADLKLTRERVRQIQVAALEKLRRIIHRGGVSADSLF